MHKYKEFDRSVQESTVKNMVYGKSGIIDTVNSFSVNILSTFYYNKTFTCTQLYGDYFFYF